MTEARANFVATLDRMAMGEPGARLWEDDGVRAWVSDGDPPTANFAVVHRIDPWSARRLADLARDSRSFRIYQMPEGGGDPDAEVLIRAGFALRSDARVMIGPPGGDPGGAAPEQEEDPTETARFIAEQFFPRSNPARRDAFARAIAAAPECRLLTVRDRAGIVAATMLSGTAALLGTYNLCVAPRKRGAGIGTDLIRWIRAHSPVPVTLQCDTRLEPWYRKVGFRTVGVLSFFSLASARDSDTI